MPEPKKRIIVDGVDFAEVFQFPRILRAIAGAMQPPRLLVGLLAVLLLVTVGRIWDGIAPARVHPAGLTTGVIAPDAADLTPRGTFASTADHTVAAVHRIVRGVVSLEPSEIFLGFGDAFLDMPIALWQHHKAFTIVYGLVALLVIAIMGGAIARMTAMETAAKERLRVIEAMQFSMTNWPRFVLAPLQPLLLAAAVGVVIVVLGLLMWIPGVDVLGGLLYAIALLLGFVVAFLLLGYALGFALLVPAVAVENCDAADAQQRAYAYVIGKPLHLLGYAIVGIVGLALGYVIVAFFAATMLNLTAGLFSAFSRNPALETAGGFSLFDLRQTMPESGELSWHSGIAAWLIGLWQAIVLNLVAAYVFSYIFSASTIVYLLLRRVNDGQDVEEVWKPGLIPGTQTPMPRTDVRMTERAVSAGVRAAAAMRYGRSEKAIDSSAIDDSKDNDKDKENNSNGNGNGSRSGGDDDNDRDRGPDAGGTQM